MNQQQAPKIKLFFGGFLERWKNGEDYFVLGGCFTYTVDKTNGSIVNVEMGE